MTDAIRRCDEHGFFRNSECPSCGADGSYVMSDDERDNLSRFMTWALRHQPSEAGISLDRHGWTSVEALVDAAQEQHSPDVTRKQLAAVVSFDEKGRFDVDGNRIRAAYGHDESLDVTIEEKGGEIPATLYHGTAPRNKEAILEDGLKPMGRASVHLTDNRQDAIDVGNRHASDGREPVLFSVNVETLEDDGYTVSRKGENVYTVDRVPPSHITIDD